MYQDIPHVCRSSLVHSTAMKFEISVDTESGTAKYLQCCKHLLAQGHEIKGSSNLNVVDNDEAI